MHRTGHEERRRRAQQRGTVLVTALVFMVVLTLVAVVAMRGTSTDLKITTNSMLHTRAFENSEAARSLMVDVLNSHVFNRSYADAWPQAAGGDVPDADFALPTGLSVCPCPSGPPANVWLNNNVALGSSNFYAPANADMQYRLAGSSAAYDVDADLYITRLLAVQAAGSSAAQVSGYEGFGKGTAGGGGYLFFDVRSLGSSVDNTTALTGSDVRIVIRN